MAKKRLSENILLLVKTNSSFKRKDAWSLPISIHWLNNAPTGTSIDSCSNCALLLILPPSTETTDEQTKEIKNKVLSRGIADSGQFRLAIDTQASAVTLPSACEINKAGGTSIDKGLIFEEKVIFVNCTIKSKEIIRTIFLEEILGSCFLETNIKIEQLISTSVKVKSHSYIADAFIGDKSRNL